MLNFVRSLVFYAGYAVIVVIFCLLLPFVYCLPRDRRYLPMRMFNRAVIVWVRVACGVRYQLDHRPALPSTPCVVVSNHESAWETYLLGLVFSPQATVMKKELLAIPFFGWLLRPLSPIAIDRSNPTRALRQLIVEGRESLRAGLWVVVFPEGTRVRPGAIGEFSKGAAFLAVKAGVSIVPVAHNAGECWPAGSMRKTPGIIRVRIDEPICTQGKKVEEVHGEVERWLQAQMAELKMLRKC